MWELCIDTGGTFTDCWGRDSTTGLERRVKVLSSSALRATVSEIRDAAVALRHAWEVPADFFSGFEARLVGESHPAVLVATSAKNAFTFEGSFGRALRSGDVIEFGTGEEPPVLGARLITHTPPGQPFPPLKIRLATTRATNALLERKGAPTAFFTTDGFRDILVIGDQRRPDLFALRHQREAPVYREVVPVVGRIDADGNEILPVELEAVRKEAQRLVKGGIRTAAVALLNAHLNPDHEREVASILRDEGFEHVTCSAEIARFIRLLPRSQTAVANAYLGPIMERFVGGVSDCLGADSVYLMTSAGGLEPASRFHPKDSLLSGPAGGIVGARSAAAAHGIEKILTFDMGGTSTDVARVDAGYSYRFEYQVGPVHLLAPALRIETVAAGGGSICQWKPSGLSVGPESAGADPGPACYGKGGPLTLTDVNFLLGRLNPETVQIPLDRKASEARLAELRKMIEAETGESIDPSPLLTGLIEIADTKMADAIRKVSVREGYDPADFTLLAFGGAGPMHACGIASRLGIRRILVPGDAGLLSAIGLHRAEIERIAERQVLRPVGELENGFDRLIDELVEEANRDLVADGFPPDAATSARRIAEIRISGQDHALQVDFASYPDLRPHFEEKFKVLFGYPVPSDREIEIVSVRVIVSEATDPIEVLPQADSGHPISGPQVVGGQFSTLFVETGWAANRTSDGGFLLGPDRDVPKKRKAGDAEAVTGELFRHRFASLVGDMGELLRLTAISTNIKERLDFSCALLSPRGELVVNAPHIPVHLGALGECVRQVSSELSLGPGDTVITNHPAYGGSHLPDVTLITPVFEKGNRALLGFVANRAHHAEIGGITPGSMPPGATQLTEEGAVIPPTYLVRAGETDFEGIFEILKSGCHPTRRLSDNAADLRAQLAANRRGESTLVAFAENYGGDVVRIQMERILDQSERAIANALRENTFPSNQAEEALDDGSLICVDIRHTEDGLIIDFNGTRPSPVHPGNLNATPAIIRSAVLYTLRLALDEDLPLNEGLLRGVEIRLPTCFLNPPFSMDPNKCPAVVGGNVETSQRVVDTLIKALRLQACSQGTMNNLLFGDRSFGYYETIAGGSGAGPGYHGTSAVQVHMTNTATTDPEILENRYPVRLRRFEIRTGSGGDGQFRGGDGVVREFEFLGRLELSLLSQHRSVPPFGAMGGAPGACGAQSIIRRDGTVERLDGEARADVEKGDRLVVETPGGGGWGQL